MQQIYGCDPKHRISLLNCVPVIRLGFYPSYFLMMWHLSAYSLWNRVRGRHTHLGESGHTHLIPLKRTHTPCRQLSLVGAWRVAIRPALSDSSLILKVRLSECDCVCDWYIYVFLCASHCVGSFGFVHATKFYCIQFFLSLCVVCNWKFAVCVCVCVRFN